jgi:hypothetical protein
MRYYKIIIIFVLFLCSCPGPEVYDPLKDPRNITRNKGVSTSPEISVDGNGNVYIAWIDTERGSATLYEYELFYKERINGEWKETEILSSEHSLLLYKKALIVDDNGDVHIVYSEPVSDVEVRAFYRMKRNGYWSEKYDVAGGEIEVGRQATICKDDLNNIYFYDPCCFTKKVNGIWGKKVYINRGYSNPEMFVEGDGKVHIVGEIGNDIEYIYSPDGGDKWEGLYLFPRAYNEYDVRPSVCAVKGKVYVAWTRTREGKIAGTYISVKDTNGVWSEPKEIIGEKTKPLDVQLRTDGEYLYLMENEIIDGNCEFIIYRMDVNTGELKGINISNTQEEGTNSLIGKFVVRNNIIYCVWAEKYDNYEIDIFYDEIPVSVFDR